MVKFFKNYQLAILIMLLFTSTSISNELLTKILPATGIKLVLVPAGTFMMGSKDDEKGHQEDELLHKVNISKSFFMGITEITQAQWEQVMGYNRSQFKGSTLPVEKLNFKEAEQFCIKLSVMENVTCRLPTEAEWEYACSAGATLTLPVQETLDDAAWYAENSNEQTHPVAQKTPNKWGFFDMHGNVSEWCRDFYQAEYADNDTTDPLCKTGKYNIIRGGAWDSFDVACRNAARTYALPSYQFKQTGLRIVVEMD